MKLLLKVLFLLVASYQLVSCTHMLPKESSIFPSKLLYPECFLDITSNTDSYFRHLIQFDSNGFFGSGTIKYSDNECSNQVSVRLDKPRQRYSYSIGNKLSNAESLLVTELIYPDPEGVGPSGSVYFLKSDLVCFAEGTFTFDQLGYDFSHVAKKENFPQQKIGSDQCFSPFSQ